MMIQKLNIKTIKKEDKGYYYLENLEIGRAHV